MRQPTRQPGWDAQAIRDIAEQQYGGFAEMFEAHGWPERGAQMMPAQGRRVYETYGSVEAFQRGHEHGRTGNALLDPKAAIESDPPDVWLTSLYGFTPGSWGFLGWSDERMRTSFLRKSRPGALVVVYAAGGAEPHLRRKVLGVQQVTHRIGTKWDFLAPERIAHERADPNRRDKWVHAIKLARGWRVPPERQPLIDDFAPVTYNKDNATAIGARGMLLTPEEARGILDLDLVEIPVFGGDLIVDQLLGAGAQVLSPSRPGPVAQSGFMMREAEGPKHLYVLRLHGEAHKFLGYDSAGKAIIKVGFSVSPQTRCDAHNKALPACAFEWRVAYSTFAEGREPFPSSRHALAGEQMMKDFLQREEKSLGGEFFLAHSRSIDRAWQAAISAAEDWRA